MNSGKFWNNQNIPQFDHNETQKVLISTFYKFGQRLGQKCFRQYILIRQYLLYSDVGNFKHIKGSVKLDGVYASFQISNSENQIYLKNNGFQIVLCTEDTNQYQLWAKLLSNCCILTTFNEDMILGKLIGNGSFSTVFMHINEVYEGRNKEGHIFAIKAIPKTKSKLSTINKQYEEQLLSEISSLRELDHVNILKLHRVYETAEKLYLVTEFIHGYELISKAASKPIFQGSELKCFIHQMLLAIKDMHQHNIMHRDIKPQNIMLKNGQLSQPCLIDFGLAVSTKKKGFPFPSCGSPGYSAPEIIRFDETKKEYGGQCDIFSFGVTLVVMLYGYNPFKAQDQKQTIKRNAEAYFEFPSNIYPQELEHLILQMTKKYPKDRITAEQALSHPFFQIKLNQTIQLPKAILSKQYSSMETKFYQREYQNYVEFYLIQYQGYRQIQLLYQKKGIYQKSTLFHNILSFHQLIHIQQETLINYIIIFSPNLFYIKYFQFIFNLKYLLNKNPHLQTLQYEMNKNFNNINVHASLEMDREFGLNYAIQLCSCSPQDNKNRTCTLSSNPNKLQQIDEFQLDCVEDSIDSNHIDKLKMSQRHFCKQKSQINSQF